MKPANYLLYLFVCSILSITTQAQNQAGQDSTGLPGDNFSLQGALEMFQKASSPEDFEKLLNSEDNHVNNLDLNGDGDIDYIRVIDKMDKDVHAFVLQVPVSETENQDIAVIELEKTGDATAILQIIGDEDIYGEQVIVEPGEEKEDGTSFNDDINNSVAYASDTDIYGEQLIAEPREEEEGTFFTDDINNGVAYRPNTDYNYHNLRVINVWFWPSVRFVYAPGYVVWHSTWRWRHYPGWWKPWRPVRWHVFHPFHRHYHNRFAIVHTHRVIHAHRIYTPARVSSVTVRTRHQASLNHYRVTRTKTTVTGPRGKKATRTTTTVRGKGGKVKATKTKVKRHR